MKYYRLQDNLYSPSNRWFLGQINFDGEWDFWKYVIIGNVDVPKKDLSISIRKNGEPLDFTMADFELLIVNEKTANLFSLQDVQLIPLIIANTSSNGKYFLMTIRNEIDCVDETKSTFEKFVNNDPIRPDKAGKFKIIYDLIVKPNLSVKNNIFRVKNYDNAIIVTDTLKLSLELIHTTGIKFLELK